MSNLGRPLSPEPSTLIVMVDEFPTFEGQVLGRELELELTAVVTSVDTGPRTIEEVHEPGRGVWSHPRVRLTVVRADIVQTT